MDGNPLARRLCIAMCRLRPLTTAIAACTHGRPAAAHRRHGALHTWASYHRTLERVVLAHRVAHGLRGTAVPIMLLHGESDTTAPVRYVRALAAEVRAVGVRAEMHVVDGDHHLAVREPAAVATAPAQLLGAPPSLPHQPAADA